MKMGIALQGIAVRINGCAKKYDNVYYVYIFSSPCIDEIFECRNGLILIFCDLRNISLIYIFLILVMFKWRAFILAIFFCAGYGLAQMTGMS